MDRSTKETSDFKILFIFCGLKRLTKLVLQGHLASRLTNKCHNKGISQKKSPTACRSSYVLPKPRRCRSRSEVEGIYTTNISLWCLLQKIPGIADLGASYAQGYKFKHYLFAWTHFHSILGTKIPGLKTPFVNKLFSCFTATMVWSSSGPYHGLWCEDTSTKHIGIIPTL